MASKNNDKTSIDPSITSVGAMVRFHRRKAGLTQIELAQLAGVGKSTVYDVEKCKLAIQYDKLLAILRILNISITYQSPLMTDYEKSTDISA